MDRHHGDVADDRTLPPFIARGCDVDGGITGTA